MLVLQDDGWHDLASWIDAKSTTTMFSDFGWGELISAIGLRVRRHLLSADQGRTMILTARVFTAGWASIVMTTGDLAFATNLVADFDRGLKLPDAIHIAIATRISADFVTADKRQGEVAAFHGLSVFNPLLGKPFE